MTIVVTFVHIIKVPMLYLLATTLFATLIFIVFRYFKRYGIDNLQAITANYVVAGSVGYLAYDKPFGVSDITGAPWFSWALVIGVFFIVVFFLFALSSQKAGVAITAVSSKMSVVIPAAAGFVLFSDQISVLKILGILAALLAFYFTFYRSGRMVLNYAAISLPLFIFIGTGTNDLLMKYTQHHYMAKGQELLMVSTIFLVSLVIGLIVLLWRILRGKTRLQPKNIFAGLVLGFINFGSTYTLFKSMAFFDSSFMFPFRNTGVVLLSAFAGILLFHEKMNRANWLGIALAVLAITLIALG